MFTHLILILFIYYNEYIYSTLQCFSYFHSTFIDQFFLMTLGLLGLGFHNSNTCKPATIADGGSQILCMMVFEQKWILYRAKHINMTRVRTSVFTISSGYHVVNFVFTPTQ